MSQKSLGTMTGTRVDSATKHVRTCRVSEDIVRHLRGKSFGKYRENDPEVSQFMVLKDDLFIACKPFWTTVNPSCMKKAYTVGISSLTGLSDIAQVFITMRFLFFDDATHLYQMFQRIREDLPFPQKTQLEWLPDFACFGVALTDGYPSGNFGDTALSVQTGGMATLQNGPFAVDCGDVLTWVWDFELPFIEPNTSTGMQGTLKVLRDLRWSDWENIENGTWKTILDPENLEDAKKYPMFFIWNACKAFLENVPADRQTYLLNLQEAVHMRNKKNNDVKNGGKVKNYNLQSMTSFSGVQSRMDRIGYSPRIIPLPLNATYTLKQRCFGKSLGFARQWDQVDILISRQGL